MFSRVCGELCHRVEVSLTPEWVQVLSFPCWLSWVALLTPFLSMSQIPSRPRPCGPSGAHPDRLSWLSWESPAEPDRLLSPLTPAPGSMHPGRPVLLRAAWVSRVGAVRSGPAHDACPQTWGLVLSPLMASSEPCGELCGHLPRGRLEGHSESALVRAAQAGGRRRGWGSMGLRAPPRALPQPPGSCSESSSWGPEKAVPAGTAQPDGGSKTPQPGPLGPRQGP